MPPTAPTWLRTGAPSPTPTPANSALASDLALGGEGVNVKATTTEGLGFVGRGEGLACQAIVLIEQTTGKQAP